MTDWRTTAKAIGLVVLYLGLGLVLTALPFILYIRYATAPDTQALSGNSTALLLQGLAQLTVFGFLTWLLGHLFLTHRGEENNRVITFLLWGGLLGLAFVASHYVE